MQTATIVIIIITCVVSILFNEGMLKQRSLLFNAYHVYYGHQWYRLFTHGFIHAGYVHLLFNMVTLYYFGPVVETCLAYYFGYTTGIGLFVFLYLSAIAVSCVGDLVKNHDNPYYNALGASGAVSAVLFSAIFFAPTLGISIMFIPISIPAFLFGPLYLWYCWYMAKQQRDNIGHLAHFSGAVYGLLFSLALFLFIR